MIQQSLRSLQKKNTALRIIITSVPYEKESIGVLCKRALVSNGTFFNYFGNEENLKYTKLVVSVLEPQLIHLDSKEKLLDWLQYLIHKPCLTHILALNYIYTNEEILYAQKQLNKTAFIKMYEEVIG